MHQRLIHLRIRELPGDPLLCFHQVEMNRETKSVFGNADLSNVSGTLLEGNKDHFLNQARSDLALQDAENEFVECRREQTRLQEDLIYTKGESSSRKYADSK